LAEPRRKRRAPEPRRTRTDRDWIMMAIGVSLIVFFLVGGYMSLREREKNPGRRIRGPVRNPKTSCVPAEDPSPLRSSCRTAVKSRFAKVVTTGPRERSETRRHVGQKSKTPQTGLSG